MTLYVDGVTYDPYLVTDDWPIHPSQIDVQLTVGACWQGEQPELMMIPDSGAGIQLMFFNRIHSSCGQLKKKVQLKRKFEYEGHCNLKYFENPPAASIREKVQG